MEKLKCDIYSRLKPYLNNAIQNAVALLGTDHRVLSGEGVGHIRDPAAGVDGPLHD